MEKLFRTLDNISIFKDTQKQCKSDSYLIEAIKKLIQRRNLFPR